MKKFQYIDSLRGLATLAVVVMHCGMFGQNRIFVFYPHFNAFNNFENVRLKTALISILDVGQFGVQLFYVLSAYTLFLSLNNRKSESDELKSFFIRRIFRIAPMYYLAIIFYTFNYIYIGQVVPKGNLISHILFLNGFNPRWINSYVVGGWSIAVEMCFYLMVPLLFKKIKSFSQSIIFFIITLLISFILNNLLNRFTDSSVNYYSYLYLPNQLPVFALGIASFFVIVKKDWKISKNAWIFIALTVFFLGFITIPVHIVFALAFSMLLIFLSKRNFPLLVNKFTQHLGTISYSMYLTHFIVLNILFRNNLLDYIQVHNSASLITNYIIRTVIVLVLSIGVSNLTYHIIEVPFQKLGKRLIGYLGRRKELNKDALLENFKLKSL